MGLLTEIENSGICCWQGLSPKGLCLTFYNLRPGDRPKIEKLKAKARRGHDIDFIKICGKAESKYMLRLLGYLGNINVTFK